MYLVQLHQEERRVEDDGGDEGREGQNVGAESQSLPDVSAVRPRLIINIMSGSNDEKSVVMGHEEMVTGEEHDQFYDVPADTPPPVVLRHNRVPPLHG